MTEEENLKYAEFKYEIIAPAIADNFPQRTRALFFKHQSEQIWNYNGEPKIYSQTTIKHWYYLYMKYGINGLLIRERSTKNRVKAISDEVAVKLKEKFDKGYKYSNDYLYGELIASKIIEGSEFSLSTLGRYIRKNDLRHYNDKKYDRRAYECKYANQLWQGDTVYMHFQLKKDNKYPLSKVAVIVFIDDASRRVTSAKAFEMDTAPTVVHTLKSGILKCGLPKAVYLDNGKAFNDRYIKKMCTKAGMVHLNTAPYNPAQKGKIEKFNRTLRDHWELFNSDTKFENMEQIQKSLDDYIQLYNNSFHTAIKCTPKERFHQDSSYIRYSTPEKVEMDFMCSEFRKVSSDGTIRLKGNYYDIDSKYDGIFKEFFFKYNSPEKVYLRDKDKLIEYKLLDKVANSNGRRNNLNRTAFNADNKDIDPNFEEGDDITSEEEAQKRNEESLKKRNEKQKKGEKDV